MKKAFSLIMALIMVVSLAACGSKEAVAEVTTEPTTAPPTDETTQPTIEETTEATTEPEPTFEEVIVVDNDECTVKITGLDPDNKWGYALKVFLENKSPDKTYMFSIRGASVNGIDSDPFFAAEVAPGKKANDEISFSDDILEELGIDFTDIEMTFRVYDNNDWSADPVALETIHVYPYGEEQATQYVRVPSDSDITLVDNEYVTAIITGCDSDRIRGYSLNIYLVNKTDTEAMFTVDEESVNGFMVDPFWAKSVRPGNCAFSCISWSNSELEENGITEVETIEFVFRSYDYDDFGRDDYINQVFTLTNTTDGNLVNESQSEAIADYESVAAVIEASGEKWHYWNVDVIGGAFFITFAHDGMADAVEAFKNAGYDENYSEWVSVKETMLSLYQSNIDLMKTLGVEDPMCFLMLVNENDHAETFVSIHNGKIISDIMAE